jgi:catechol 2,3-dioxygenase-like lactoylglutathione lyase family enzyme
MLGKPRQRPGFFLVPILFCADLSQDRSGWIKDQNRMTRLRRVDHVLLAMPPGRENDARAFYHGVLGIPEIVKPQPLAARGGCWFEAGEVKIHLGVENNFTPARKAHPAFVVDDLPGLTRDLRQAGYTLAEDAPLEGHDRIFVNDPFGNRIELIQPKNGQA